MQRVMDVDATYRGGRLRGWAGWASAGFTLSSTLLLRCCKDKNARNAWVGDAATHQCVAVVAIVIVFATAVEKGLETQYMWCAMV